jgi:O-acetyl-ADP-ribose deacetylase (regulator of RNase III)
VITRGGNLRARHVIHTVGPIWHGGTEDEDQILASAYRNSLRVAMENGLHSVAFPSISTGVYGFPPDRAAQIALSTVMACAHEHGAPALVRFVVFSAQDADIYSRLFATPPLASAR